MADRRPQSLRTAVLWDEVSSLAAALQQRTGRALRVLDLGGGTGGLAVPLARLGHQITVVDPSPDALAALSRRAFDAQVADRISGIQGDGDTLGALTAETDPFDLACCHGTLEVVDDETATLTALAGILRPSGALSLVVAGRLAAVIARTLAGDFTGAEQALSSRDGRFGDQDPLPRRFDVCGLQGLLDRTGFATDHVTGLRIFSDLVPAVFLDSDGDRDALLALERAALQHQDYGFLGQLGSSLHAVARRR